ncbi:MAG: ATP-grasp domain-containing protein [bacterium]
MNFKKKRMSDKNGAMPKILVTDSHRGSAIAIIRSLGRKGYRVVAADSNPRSLGFQSRYAREKVVYPNPESQPQEFCDFILDTVQKQGIDLVLPVTDLVIQPLASRREDFSGKTKLAIPENELLQAVTDKDQTVQIAQKLGVPTPATFTVRTAAEALAKAKELGWPVVLKPQISRLLRQGERIEKYSVSYANDAEDLQRQMSELEGKCSVLLQRYLEGIGYGVELLMHEGRPLAAFEHKRLREVPLTGGPSAYRESVRLHPELYQYSVRILKELRWTGLAMVEFKVGNERAELMEINGRVWGSLPLAIASGVDFPAMLVELYLNGADAVKPQLNSEYKIGLKCRDLGRDLMWMVSVLIRRQKVSFLPMPNRVQALSAFLSLFDPRNKFDLLCFDDPRPGLAELPRIYQKFRVKRQQLS